MANFRGARHLSAAMTSVLRQSHADLELIVADDASPDDSIAIVRRAMEQDDRIRLIESARNAGPAATRNRAMDVATGDWIAIVDSDDLLHPQRLERLLAAADRLGADIIADDAVFFGPTPEACGTTLLLPLALTKPLTVTPDLYLRGSGENRDLPAFGYLKPMFRRGRLGDARYDETLRIGEDFDLVLHLLLRGLHYVALPDPMYLYRRHNASISHRLSAAAVAAMLAAHDRLVPGATGTLRPALATRRQGLVSLGRYEGLVAAIRARELGKAGVQLVRHPPLLFNLARSLAERLSRKRPTLVHKSQAEVRLGSGVVAENGHLAVDCPLVPTPGTAWADPPAHVAARLSQLTGTYDLSCIVMDDAGAWAADLVTSLTADRPEPAKEGARLAD
jgi:succinoglycan biosynthesis protein ExoO